MFSTSIAAAFLKKHMESLDSHQSSHLFYFVALGTSDSSDSNTPQPLEERSAVWLPIRRGNQIEFRLEPLQPAELTPLLISNYSNSMFDIAEMQTTFHELFQFYWTDLLRFVVEGALNQTPGGRWLRGQEPQQRLFVRWFEEGLKGKFSSQLTLVDRIHGIQVTLPPTRFRWREWVYYLAQTMDNNAPSPSERAIQIFQWDGSLHGIASSTEAKAVLSTEELPEPLDESNFVIRI